MARIVNTSPFVKIPDGVDAVHERITPANALLVTQMHGRFYELCRQGNLFWAGNMAGAAHAYSVAMTTTYTGICVSNPAGNSKDVIIEAVGFAASVHYEAESHVGLMGGYTVAGVVTHTVPCVWGTDMGCLFLGAGGTATAKADEDATIVAPRYLMPLGREAIANAMGGLGSFGFCDVGGAIRLAPGAWCAIHTLTALTGNGVIWWSEDPR